MRTPENLSDQAKRIVKDAQERNVGVRELISVYECWRSAEHPIASTPSAPGDLNELLASVRQRLGLTRETSDKFEALGDAIDMLVGSAGEDVKKRWHEAKVMVLESADRDKKMIALRHLDPADYDDEIGRASCRERV